MLLPMDAACIAMDMGNVGAELSTFPGAFLLPAQGSQSPPAAQTQFTYKCMKTGADTSMMEPSGRVPWDALPAGALQRLSTSLASDERQAVMLTCKSWHRGCREATKPRLVTADVLASDDVLAPVPSWALPSLQTLQLCVSSVVPVGEQPPDHFGPADMAELRRALQRLDLAQWTKHAEPVRALRLVMGAQVVRESLLAQTLQDGGVLHAFPKLEVVCEPSTAALNEPGQSTAHWFSPLSLNSPLPAAHMLLDGSLAQHLTVCHLSTGLFLATGEQLVSTQAASNSSTTYPHLHTLGLCLERCVITGTPASSPAQPTAPVQVREWDALLSTSTLPSLRSLCLHTGRVVVSVPGSLASLTTLEHLIITGCGIKLQHADEVVSQLSSAASLGQAVGKLTRLNSLRMDGFYQSGGTLHLSSGSNSSIALGQTLDVGALVAHTHLHRLSLGVDVRQAFQVTTPATGPRAHLQCLLLCLLGQATKSDGHTAQQQQQQQPRFTGCAQMLDLRAPLGGLLSVQDVVLCSVDRPISGPPLLPTNLCAAVQRIWLSSCSVQLPAAQQQSPKSTDTQQAIKPSTGSASTESHQLPSAATVQLTIPPDRLQRQLARSAEEQLSGPAQTHSTAALLSSSMPGSSSGSQPGQGTPPAGTEARLLHVLASQYLAPLADVCPRLNQLVLECVWWAESDAPQRMEVLHLVAPVRSPVRTSSDLRHIFSQSRKTQQPTRLDLAPAPAPAEGEQQVWGAQPGDAVCAEVVKPGGGSWEVWSRQAQGVRFSRR